ncbi:MAG: hypothetical protein R6V85_06075 [Polyangia bacterium]
MSWTYSCPYCDCVVNPDETVILVAERNNQQMLIGFHPQPGNYTIYVPQSVQLSRGDVWEFFCPLCRANLRSEEHPHLAALLVWQGDVRRRVLFSRVVGEQATYIVQDKDVAQRLGEHADLYDTKKMRRIKPETLH